MSFSRREFMQVLAVASAGGMALDHKDVLAAKPGAGQALYDLPKFGNVSFLHFTDCHAQLMPIHFREPNVNLGVGEAVGRPPHIVGEAMLKHYGIRPGTAQAHAFTYLNFEKAARTYGKVGGFAHLATLVKMLKADRPHALLLDGGDTWQGSATSLWTNGQDMIDACKLLGVNMMTPHWEFTFGAQRVQEVVEKDFKGHIEFLAQNIKTTDFEDQVFKPYALREMNGVKVAVIGQAFPYTPIANPRYMVPDWTFGIQDEHMQKMVDQARGEGAQAVVVLSHNGMDVDIKMASRVRGIDAVLGGHTHDGMPAPVIVKNAGGQTLVTNAGSNGKFLAVLDFDVRGGKVQDFRYKLLPVFANLLPADAAMQALIDKVRAPYKDKLEEQLAVTEDLLYRRGNFNGSWDQLICEALMEVKGADMSFSPGVRWGTSLLPGEAITYERMMDQMALTYPATTLNEFTGTQIKEIMEDVCDNIFNPDPYYQQGGDMVRVGGMTYSCTPNAPVGQRINNMMLKGKPIEADKKYKVAGWASVQQGAQGEPIWDVVSGYLRNKKVIKGVKVNTPALVGMQGNPGMVV
ncbi:thiosulfohydrolase SoxB [Hydrogenophaga sp. NFH-34]|uniref:thiosulfohydrolase SoxB n=1 Tax=Hydrogenophaga sp. NFH-34 TaxID=2744446 RepID=UPI001F488A3E|nr:thiosulfohydrolase SoxB [Hydrogenophaga sp. NFH-34]